MEPPAAQVMGVQAIVPSGLSPEDAAGLSPEDAAALLAKETGIIIGEMTEQSIKSIPGSGSAGMMPATGIQGSVPVSNASGTLLATLHFCSTNREMGMVNSKIVLVDGTNFAQLDRPVRQKWFPAYNDPFSVALAGQMYATIASGGKGTLSRADGSGGLAFNRPCCQPVCKWICLSFCCFFCTVGVSACVGVVMAGKTKTVVNIKSLDGAVKHPPLSLDQSGLGDSCDFGSMDPRGKLDLFFLVAAQAAEKNCQPPQGNNGGGGGGGG